MLICSFFFFSSSSIQTHPKAHPYDDDNQRWLRLFLSLYPTPTTSFYILLSASSAQTHIERIQQLLYRKYNQQSIGCTLESSIREILTKVHFTKNSEKILVRVYPTLPIKFSAHCVWFVCIQRTQNLMLRSVFPFQTTIKFPNTLYTHMNLTYLKTLLCAALSSCWFSTQSLVVFRNHKLDGAIPSSKVGNLFEDVLVN